MIRPTLIIVLLIILILSVLQLHRSPREQFVTIQKGSGCGCGQKIDLDKSLEIKESFCKADTQGELDCSCGKSPCCCIKINNRVLNSCGSLSCQCPGGKKRFPVPSMYSCSQKTDSLKGRICQPYFKRSWPTCSPTGTPDCKKQSYIEEYFLQPNEPIQVCQESCDPKKDDCNKNPYGQNYSDPRWRNLRFYHEQEWAPGLPKLPHPWIPTAPIN